MDTVSYFVFAFLLTVKIVTASKGDSSVNLTYKKAMLEKSVDGLYIIDGNTASFIKDSDTFEMQRKKIVFKKDLAEGTTKIDDGQSTYLNKFSDGTVEIHAEKSTILKYDAEDVDVSHGNSIKIHRDSNKLTIEEGVLSLTKDFDESTATLYDKLGSITKYSNEYVAIRGKNLSLEKESGDVKIQDGPTTFIEKKSEGTVEICHSKSYIKKYSDGESTVRDGNVCIINEADGNAEVRNQDLLVIDDENGNLTLSDGHSSIVKDSTKKSTMKNGTATIVKDEEGIKVSVQAKGNGNLMVDITDHVLYVGSNSASFDVKIPNRITEENVQMCFSSNGTINILVPKKKMPISCPHGTTRSETLKKYQK